MKKLSCSLHHHFTIDRHNTTMSMKQSIRNAQRFLPIGAAFAVLVGVAAAGEALTRTETAPQITDGTQVVQLKTGSVEGVAPADGQNSATESETATAPDSSAAAASNNGATGGSAAGTSGNTSGGNATNTGASTGAANPVPNVPAPSVQAPANPAPAPIPVPAPVPNINTIPNIQLDDLDDFDDLGGIDLGDWG